MIRHREAEKAREIRVSAALPSVLREVGHGTSVREAVESIPHLRGPGERADVEWLAERAIRNVGGLEEFREKAQREVERP